MAAPDGGGEHVDGGEIFGLHRIGKGLGRELRRGRALGRTSRVDQHIDRAERGFGRIQRRQGMRRIAQIGRHRVDAFSRKVDVQFLQGIVQVDRVTRDQRDPRAFFQKGVSASQANAFAAASDQNMLVA